MFNYWVYNYVTLVSIPKKCYRCAHFQCLKQENVLRKKDFANRYIFYITYCLAQYSYILLMKSCIDFNSTPLVNRSFKIELVFFHEGM